MPRSARDPALVLDAFHPAVAGWFRESFAAPTPPQVAGWPRIADGENTLILAPTGTGKTLAAFLACLDRLLRAPEPAVKQRCRVVYVSPLKALAVDIERNLEAPLAGIARIAARRGEALRPLTVAVRTGDTPAADRARFQRAPADILITTPESLYLLLTSNAAAALRGVDTVIVDEIHALVPGKRGAHLALTLERLERAAGRPLQRIGLSATQRPLDEVARFLGGAAPAPPRPAAARSRAKRATAASAGIPREFAGRPREVAHRPVAIVDTGQKKPLALTIEVPVEDMARLGEPLAIPSGPAAQGPVRASIWTAIHPRLLELIRAHRTTLVFVNNRRSAERLAGALNELAGEILVRSHHGSLARPQRIEVEDRLKAGQLKGLVATSSLELGIDMGAIDLVVQIESPPSVASGLQRIGRGGHQVGAPSTGIVFPKYRGDLIACAAVTRAMHEGRVEAIRYPRNPLDVLAQQIVAMVAMEPWSADELFAFVRRAAPFAELSREAFDGVLDMLAGRFPADDFAELRPRLTWDRVRGTLTTREGAKRIAVVNGGTIPDRGLYGVFLAGADKGAARVGELDEEMVFESKPGETFVLGASTWRIEEIGHDRVTVSPAPGEPGKMPFWKGEGPGRPLELGLEIGKLVRTLRGLPPATAVARLTAEHDLDQRAAENLLQYLRDQEAAVAAVPDDRTVLIESCRDELGDWRMCVLTPFGARVHAPWAMAAAAKVRAERGLAVEVMWLDDGFVVRFPETDEPPDPALVVPAPGEVEELVMGELGGTSLFAARFRENAARALLLPRRRPGGRAPLWQQRKRAHDLLAVASRFGSFPMLLETYRECLRDVFDLPALVTVLGRIARRATRVVSVASESPSPFASAVLFGYVANYLYDGDAPLAERRAQALAIDQAQLRELLGEAELRELLDPDAIDEIERQLQHLDPERRARSEDQVHDLLLALGDLGPEELAARSALDDPGAALARLVAARRVVELRVAGGPRYVPAEYAARYRDGLGVPLPPGLPESLLARVPDAAAELARRFARRRAPFTTRDFAARYGLALPDAERALRRLEAAGRIAEGAFRPDGTEREWCDQGVLTRIRRRSLAKLRREVEPVEPRALARMVTSWQGVVHPRRGMDALLDAIETLQGAALTASTLESEVLPARIEGYRRSDLDALAAAGEIVWCGLEPLGERDGRIALYLTDHLPRLWSPPGADDAARRPGPPRRAATPPPEPEPPGAREQAILDHLAREGASFYAPLHEAAGGGFPGDTVDALWSLAWRGLVTNDALHALRAFLAGPGRREPRGRRARPHGTPSYRSRRMVPAAAQGRWSLVAPLARGMRPTERRVAVAQQLLQRYGVVTREVAAAESLAGGFSAVYPVLRAMEEAGKIRRGFFVAGVAATQFALPPALDLLRSLRSEPAAPEVVVLAATDPANPYGALLPWPPVPGADPSPLRRVARARVILCNGLLAAWLAPGGRKLHAFLPEDEPQRATLARATAAALAGLAADPAGRGLLIEEIDGRPPREHPLAAALAAAGFAGSPHGLHLRPEMRLVAPAPGAADA